MKYEQPMIEILKMGYEDVICLSGKDGGDNEGEFLSLDIGNGNRLGL